MKSLFRLRVLLTAALLFGFDVLLHAHDPGLSTATLRAKSDVIEAVVTFSVADAGTLAGLDNDLDGKVTPAEFAYGRTRLGELVARSFIVSFDGQEVKSVEPSLLLDDQNNVIIHLRFPGHADAKLGVQSGLLALLPAGHRQFLSVQDATGKLFGESLLSAKADRYTVDLASSTGSGPTQSAGSFFDFLVLGIKHILIGYDHLLFLFALLLVTPDFLSAIKVVTCFTVAHSITLAVATFNLVQIPGSVVEPLIAASIVYVGVENFLRHGATKGRWLLTFAFGLVHGFGFASVLSELGVASGESGIVVPLVSFNLGVEAGQIGVASLALPLIWKLKQRPAFARRYVPACSILIALAGGYWLIERVLPASRF